MTNTILSHYQLSSKEDDFSIEQWVKHTRWFVKLDSGEIIFQDDDRPGVTPCSAWLRLKTLIQNTDMKISEMWIQFRNNKQTPLPKNSQGYFFSKSIISAPGLKEPIGFYLIGYAEENKVDI